MKYNVRNILNAAKLGITFRNLHLCKYLLIIIKHKNSNTELNLITILRSLEIIIRTLLVLRKPEQTEALMNQETAVNDSLKLVYGNNVLTARALSLSLRPSKRKIDWQFP